MAVLVTILTSRFSQASLGIEKGARDLGSNNNNFIYDSYISNFYKNKSSLHT